MGLGSDRQSGRVEVRNGKSRIGSRGQDRLGRSLRGALRLGLAVAEMRGMER